MDVLTVVGKPFRILRWRSIEIDQDRGIVFVAGSKLATSDAEFRLVELLVSNRDLPLAKEAILNALFAPGHGRDPRQVDVFVARLRRSFNAAGIGDVIVNVAGRGYAIFNEDGAIDQSDALTPTANSMPLAA